MPAIRASRPVNVASVPQRSPFRYPGGKTWLIPQIRAWLTSIDRPELLVEPFAGGASVTLSAVDEDLVDHAVISELDPHVAVVWRVIVHGDADRLARLIETFDLNERTVREELAVRRRSDVGRAFQTILRNRVQRGGIMAPGAGLMRNGEAGKGIASRWYPETLARRIRDIQKYRHRISFVEADAFEVIREHLDNPSAALFIDPPYTAGGKSAGSRLYAHCGLDHAELFRLCGKHPGDVLLTYDNAVEVRDLATEHDFEVAPIAMRSTHNATMSELLVGRNLDWVK